MNSKTFRNSCLLFLTALIWGLAFVSQSKGMEAMGPFTFNGIRSLLGGLVLLPPVIYRIKKQQRDAAGKGTAASFTVSGTDWKVVLTGGLLCGLAYTTASTLQQFGINYTTIGKAGFITTLYIIFVPIFGIFLKKKVPGRVWFGALLAAVGMYLLCMTESFSVTGGDMMVFLSALLFAGHILIIDHYSPKADGVLLSCMQLFVCGISCTLAAFLFEHPTWTQVSGGLSSLLYAGIMSCGVGYTLQIVGQKDMNPTVASLILSLESVIATVMGFLAYKAGFLQTDQTLTGRQIAGCVIVFAAVVLVQLPIGSLKKNK